MSMTLSRCHHRGLAIQKSTEIFHVADVIIGRAAVEANMLRNLLTKTLEDVRMLTQQVDGKCKSSSGLIT